MIKNNYFSDVSDIRDQFEEIIDWNEIIDNYENGFEEAEIFDKTGNEFYASAPHNREEAIEYYRVILDAIGDIAGNIISQNVREMEKEGLKFDNGKVIFPELMIESVNKVKEAGLQPYGFSRKYGGLGLPFTVKSFMNEILYRVDAGTAIAIGCVNLAEIIEKHASEELKSEWIPKMAGGEFCCAMGLTEPNFGSDLPNITTKATRSENGKWILNGTKRFITQACGFADIPSVILTLARTGELNSGARGLSFFIVHSKDVQIASIETKMGLHCSPTCEVILENSPGLLVGEEGYGLIKYVIGMLNGARMGIAYQSTGLATAAFHEARKYAEERIQFGKPIIEIPAVRKILNRMERETAAMRCISLEGSRVIDLYYWRSEHLKKKGLPEKEISSDEQVRFYEKLANLFTPIAKFHNSETCNRIAGDAVQIHGGAGYTEDFDVSRIYREARITTIYDGTSQIQVMAAIGGIVSGMSAKGILRQYIEQQIGIFPVSEDLKEMILVFEESVSEFKSIKKADLKEEMSTEIVESAARLLGSLLLEKSLSRISDEKKNFRQNHSKNFNLDSLAVLSGNLRKVKAVSFPGL